MIFREYYSLETAAKLLDCTVDDFIHLAANEILKIYLLTDGFTCGTSYSSNKEILLPTLAPVVTEHWQNLEIGMKSNLGVEAFDFHNKKCHVFGPFTHMITDEKISLTNLVILHTDITSIANKKNEQKTNHLQVSNATHSNRIG